VTVAPEVIDVQNPATSQSRAPSRPAQASWWWGLLQEPLLHFSVLGIALFAVASYWGDATAGPEDNEIVVTAGKVRSLAHIFQRTWQRPPTQSELDALIEDFVNEEVFYREALAMGLDRDDTIIRRRLRQKLEFVAEDLADSVEPTDEELAEYMAARRETYRLENQATFTQVYFSPQRRAEALHADLEQALQTLRGNDAADVTEFGDPLLLPTYHESVREREIASMFGREFSQSLQKAETGRWSGPIESSYGLHLVKVDERTPGRVPTLDEVRDVVRRDWFADRRAESKRRFYDSLRERYEVIVDMPVAEESGDDVSDGAGNDTTNRGEEAESRAS
jgi:hypothetical protein